MKAAVLTSYDVFEIADVPDPEVTAPTDVIVEISGAGVCGSDVHLAEGVLEQFVGELEFPFLLGHENAGHVVAVGDQVRGLAVGDPVLMHPHISCGLCRACRRGHETYCENLRFPGVDGTPGGYAEYLRTDAHAVIKLPEGTDPTLLASLTDAGLSSYHSVRRTVGDVAPDGTALVIGIGGLGHFAVQLLPLFTPAAVIAVDTDPERMRSATALGADHAVAAGDRAAAEIMELSGGQGVDLVIDAVGVRGTSELAMEVLARGGRLSVLGAGDGEVCCATPPMTGRELSLDGSLVGSLGELTELVGIALRGKLSLPQTYYALGDTAIAVEDLRHGRVHGRAVLTP